jgi:hypothetical protein
MKTLKSPSKGRCDERSEEVHLVATLCVVTQFGRSASIPPTTTMTRRQGLKTPWLEESNPCGVGQALAGLVKPLKP